MEKKVANRSRGDMPPPVVFHASITDQKQLLRLVKRMEAGEAVPNEDKLYLTACNHNYASDVEAYKRLVDAGVPPEEIVEFIYFPCYVMTWPGHSQRKDNIDAMRAVSITNLSFPLCVRFSKALNLYPGRK